MTQTQLHGYEKYLRKLARELLAHVEHIDEVFYVLHISTERSFTRKQ